MAVVKPPPKKKLPPGASPASPSPQQQLAATAKPGAAPKLPANPLAKPAAAPSTPRVQAVNASPQAKGAPAADDAIEKRVLQQIGATQILEPAVFRDFIEKICPKLSMADTTRAILGAFSSPDVTSEKVAECIKANPYYEYQFLKVIESMSKREDKPKLEAAIVMMGMQNSRNLILALQMLRTCRGLHPEWGKDGKLKVASKEILKHALKTEEALAGNRDGYSDIAYAAGMLFDAMAMVAGDVSGDKRMSGLLEGVYAHGLRAAKLGLELSKKIPDFAFKKYIFAACLIHDIGKVALAALEPSYFDFLEDASKREMPRAVRMLVERERYGVNHTLLSAVCCYYFKIFKPIEKAILYHHDPYLLKDNRNLFQVAAIVSLASNVANNFKKTDKPEDPILRKWKGTELKDFRFEIKDVMAAVQKMN